MADVPNGGYRGSSSDGAWPEAFAMLAARLRRSIWLVLVFAIAGAALGLAARAALPQKFSATAQILIDPRSMNVFSNEPVNSQLDANAAVNFVESQMQVIGSERVLARVIRDDSLSEELKSGDDDAISPAETQQGDPAGDMRLRPSLGVDGKPLDPAALNALSRAITIKRNERSYIVDVTASARTPELAARLANGVVKAFIDEDAASRAEAGRRLTGELTGRLDELRKRLQDSESKAEEFRRQNGLVASGDKLIVEQKLGEAVTELSASQARLSRAEGRVDQLDRAQRDLGSLGALTPTEDMRTISYLIERLSAARENLAELSLNLGARHPALASARSRVSEIDSRIVGELNRIREAAKADLNRARAEQQGLTQTVAALSADVSKARQAQIELRSLSQDVEANKALLATFETRAREANEFGRIATVNLRVVSVALPTEGRSALVGAIVFAIVGALVGVILAIGLVTLLALLSIGESRVPAFVARERVAVRTPPAGGAGAGGQVRRAARAS